MVSEMNKNILALIFFSVFVLSCSGCSTIPTNVTPYYNQPLNFAGQTYTFYPSKKIHQDIDPQYDYFASLLNPALQQQGLIPTQINNAKYIAVLLYWVGTPLNKIGSNPVYGQVGTSVISSYSNGYINPYGYSDNTQYITRPVYGVVGASNFSYQVFPYNLIFAIYNKADATNLSNSKPIYAAIVTASSDQNQPNIIFPNMIRAFSHVFPGASGRTRVAF